jgi:hypothetical protein
MAKAPNPRRLAAKKRAEAAQNYRLALILDDNEWVFRLADVTATDVADLRRATGWRVLDLVRELSTQGTYPEPDAIAAAVWLARRQAGERDLPYESVAQGVTVGSEYEASFHSDVEAEEEDGGFPDPPPSGGD